MPPSTHLYTRFETELYHNILPFWATYSVDKINGGFYGAVSPDLRIMNEVPRSAVLCARILWTYSTAYRLKGDPDYLAMADHAYQYLTQIFWDMTHGGVYWSVDYQGQPVDTRKQIYAQAFAIYGLSEYYRATQNQASLQFAQRLFELVDIHSYDPQHGGNFDSCDRNWQVSAPRNMVSHQPASAKSMNTLLHLLESYTNLLRIWPNEGLKLKLRGLIELFLTIIIDPQSYHLKLFFDRAWHSLTPLIASYGHDIEASWLLVEAAEVLGATDLMEQTQNIAVKMANVTYHEAVEANGAVWEDNATAERPKVWWVQTEAVVGFYNAYQISQQAHFAEAADRCWAYIESHFVDHEHGDWFKLLDPNGQPDLQYYKIGPWQCPYHHSRTCFEMLSRLKSS